MRGIYTIIRPQIMDGNKEQFSRIYDEYIEKIYRFVYLKVNSQEVAQDLTSKVFLNGWEAFQKQSDIKNPGAFLYQIARNITVDYYREKGRSKVVNVENLFYMPDTGKNPHEKAVLNDDLEGIKLAISKLKAEYQDILIWYYLEDMSADQIATLTGKPAGTVRVMIHRGLEMLKGQFHQES